MAIHLIAGVYQDGAQFYREAWEDQEDGGLIASYPDLVRNDSDTAGADAARLAFFRDYPEYAYEADANGKALS